MLADRTLQCWSLTYRLGRSPPLKMKVEMTSCSATKAPGKVVPRNIHGLLCSISGKEIGKLCSSCDSSTADQLEA